MSQQLEIVTVMLKAVQNKSYTNLEELHIVENKTAILENSTKDNQQKLNQLLAKEKAHELNTQIKLQNDATNVEIKNIANDEQFQKQQRQLHQLQQLFIDFLLHNTSTPEGTYSLSMFIGYEFEKDILTADLAVEFCV